eukprot:m.22724 g.22724  ORF g.22724 m.22724 type:complete len:239 (-) comp13924_c0_seq1:536-1252(-)
MAETRRYKATHDYVAKGDGELTFKSGDILFVPLGQKDKNGMLNGVCNGKVGKFPSIYVSDTTVEVKNGQPTRVSAVRAYEGHGIEGHLEFPKDAKLFIVGKHDDHHFKGVYAGNTGIVPATHVHSAVKLSQDTTLAGLRCIAIKTMVDDHPGKLSFKAGMVIFVPKASSEAELWTGVSQGVVGEFPKSYVVDSATQTKEEIDAIVKAVQETEEEKELAEKFESLMVAREEQLTASRAN